MTEEERDKNLEELFRRKLEENEMVADSNLTGRFMRRLERREFVRFNPARFNIYYLAVAVAGLTMAALIIFRSTDGNFESGKAEPEPSTTGTIMPGNDIYAIEKTGENAETTITETKTAADARKAGTAPGVITERPSGIFTSSPSKEKIKVKQPENEVITLAGRAPGATIEASVSSGCVPLHVHYRINAEKPANIQWNFGDGGSSTEINPDYVYDIPGTYKVSLVTSDGKGHTGMTTIYIEAFAVPRAEFDIRQDEPDDESGQVHFVNLSDGAVKYLWDFGDGTLSSSPDPSHTFRQSGIYNVKLTAWSENGCADSVIINDAFADKGTYIRFPNAFVPNHGGPTGGYYSTRTDEDNQVFHPVASGVAAYNLKIYSKAGLLVFESNELEMGWDGYYKGQKCSPGVYVWKVRGTFRNGQPIIMAGDITLLDF
jgi:PKD repeat protein